MLVPNVPMEYFEDYGFKKCKGSYGKSGLYYLCVARGSKLLLVSNVMFDVQKWGKEQDPRIHKNANCKYSDIRDYLDIIYDLIIKGMLTSERR